MITHFKIAKAGSVLELAVFEKPVLYGWKKITDKERSKDLWDNPKTVPLDAKFKPNPSAMKPPKCERYEATNLEPENMSAVWRAKAKLRRLINANAWQWLRTDGKPCMPIFISYTFAEEVKDPKEAHRMFSLFTERLNDRWADQVIEGLKYVAIPELQMKYDRGVYHYHALYFNLPKIPRIYDEIDAAWSHGYTRVKSVKSYKGLRRYLTKYLGKDLSAGRHKNGKRYFASRGLLQPEIIRTPELVTAIIEALPPNSLEWQSEPIENAYYGHIWFTRFVVSDGFDLDALIDEKFREHFSRKRREGGIVPVPTGTPADGRAQESVINNKTHDDRD